MRKHLFILSLAVLIFHSAKAQLTADFTADTTSGCAPLTVSFSDLSTGSPTSWNWSFGDGSNSSLQNPTHTFASPGTYTIDLLIIDSITSDDTEIKPGYITVYGNEAYVGPDQTVCSNNSTISLNGFISGATGLIWTTDGTGNFANDTALNTTYTLSNADLTSGTVLIALTTTGNGSCSAAADSLTILIPNPQLQVTLTSTPELCNGCCDGTVTVSVSGGTTPYMYQWSNGIICWSNPCTGFCTGNFNLTLTDASGCTNISNVQIGNSLNPLITGHVFTDSNANCVMETGDSALYLWTVKAVGISTHYGSVNSNGFYNIWVPAGNYTVRLVQKPFWDLACPLSPGYYNVTASGLDTVENINFGNQISVYCPNLKVSISSGNLRPCFNANYSLSVQNTGTAPAVNATVDVTLDNGVSYVSLNPWGSPGITLASQSGNTLTFNVGTIYPGQIIYFSITVFLDCSMPLGVTKCVEAHAYPDSICAPVDSLWDRSSVSVEGICQNDSLACFTIINNGSSVNGNMQGTSPYRIYSNNILVSSGTFQLAGGDSIVICWPANNNTIRLEADQRPGHPGNSHPQASVELCGDPVFTLGQINLVPQDDADDFIDIDCRVTTASYDPNDKAVQPEGLTSQFHFIDSTDILEYKIQFQNTGTDTAFNVYIYDTLSNFVDVTTFESGASSHPYTYEIAGEGIVRFHFENILLPDSNVNEPASHGFVKYEIRQKPGNVKGTKIENTAGIVFDFNEPVITNTTFNTVGNIDSLTIPVPVLYNENIFVKVYPNPFTSETTFEISGSEKELKYSLEIFNLVGQKVKSFSRNNSKIIIFNREGISDGIYFYKITSETNLLSAGKIIIR